MLLRLLVPILLHSPDAPSAPAWSGEFTLTMKGSGTTEKTLSTGVRARVTWKVDRVATGRIVLDVARYSCPARDSKDPMGQVRSSILQFDYERGTFSFEAPRLFTRCDVSYLRTPARGTAEWMAKAPVELESRPVELEFEMVHKMNSLPEWRVMTGPFSRGATEVVLSRTFLFQWMQPLEGVQVPINADLKLVLHRSS